MSKRGLTSLLFVLGADISEFQTELRKSTREMEKWGKDVQRTGKTLSTYVTAPLVAMGGASVMAFRNLNESMKQIEAGIASTGGAAGFTATELKAMADEMGQLTSTLNQDILQGVTAQLLTFTNITGDAFKEAQMAAMDLSARMGTDLRSSAMMVGRALNDPIQGMTALSRAGVQFSDQQRDTIRAMMDTGDVAAAQRVILQELETQFGGSAEAAGDAFSDMRNAAIMLGQEFGELIYNAVTPLIEKITGLITWITELDDRWKGIIVTAGGVAAAIGPVLIGIGYMSSTVIPQAIRGVNAIVRSFYALRAAMLANPWMAAAAGLAAVTAAVVMLRRRTNELAALEESRARISNDLNAEYDKQASKVKILTGTIENEAVSLRKRRDAIEELNRIMPDYNAHLDDEGVLHEHNTELIERGLEALKERIALSIVEAELTELMQKQRDVRRELTEAEEKLTRAQNRRADALEGTRRAMVGGQDAVIGYAAEVSAAEREVNKSKDALNGLSAAVSTLEGEYQGMLQTMSSFSSGEKDLNDGSEERIGILQQLNDELKKLRDTESQATTPQQIAEIRDLITAKEKEIEAVESQIRAYQLLNEVRQGSPIRMTGVGLDDKPDIQPRTVTSKVDEELIQLVNRYTSSMNDAVVRNQVFGDSFDLVSEQTHLTRQALNELIEMGFEEGSAEMDYFIQKLAELESQLESNEESFNAWGAAINNGIRGVSMSFAEGIGQMVAGTGDLSTMFDGVLDSLAGMLEDLGRLAIMTGVAIQGIRDALKSLNPVVAIVAGTALIGLAQVVRSRTSNMAQGMSAPGMAEGGVVPGGYPGDTYPARLTSGEIVLPPKKLETFLSDIHKKYNHNVTHDSTHITQFVDQVVHFSDDAYSKPPTLTQIIDQVVNPVSVSQPDPITQEVRQVTEPVSIQYSTPPTLTKFVDQVVRPVTTPSPETGTHVVNQVEGKTTGHQKQTIYRNYVDIGAGVPDLLTQVVRYMVPVKDTETNISVSAPKVSLPKMAMGGIVPPGFPNDSYPALLSSGEKVYPDPMPLEGEGRGGSAMKVLKWERAGSDLLLYMREAEVDHHTKFGQ